LTVGFSLIAKIKFHVSLNAAASCLSKIEIMKMLKTLIVTVTALAIIGLSGNAFAAEKAAKERTITGTAKCAKCSLKKSDTCQTVIEQAGRNGKTREITVANNDVAKSFHENICKVADGKKVKATGTMKKGDDGKMEFVATKIETVE
jgi:hypothetical protein